MKTLALAGVLLCSAALAEDSLVDADTASAHMLDYRTHARLLAQAEGVTSGNNQTITGGMTVGWLQLLPLTAAPASLTVGLYYNSGTGYITLGPNGNGLLMSGTAQGLNLATASGNNAITLQTAGARINLNNSTDYFYDNAGVATFNSSLTVESGSLSGQNIAASNSLSGTSNVCAGYNGSSFSGESACLQAVAAGREKIDLSNSTDAAVHLDFLMKGAGDLQVPQIAAASLLTCTASTENTTNSQAGAHAYDSTNSANVTCNGTRWVYDDLWKTCTMSSGTTCTVAVPSGTTCSCVAQSGATASALSCAVASTTATCTASASNSLVWNVIVH